MTPEERKARAAMTKEERAAIPTKRLAEKRALREATRKANREAWAKTEQARWGLRRDTAEARAIVEATRTPAEATAARRKAARDAWTAEPANAYGLWREQREAENTPIPGIVVDQLKRGGSGSLDMLRAIMADTEAPIYRRLDAADVIIDYELAPGAGVNVPSDQLASTAYQFYRQVATAEETPDALKFRAIKSIARIENSRKAAAQSPEAHFANREFYRRLINAARAIALREAGIWEQVVVSDAHWMLGPRDNFDPPELPRADIHASVERDGTAEFLDACNRQSPEQKQQRAAERRAILLAVRASNRVDDWDALLGPI